MSKPCSLNLFHRGGRQEHSGLGAETEGGLSVGESAWCSCGRAESQEEALGDEVTGTLSFVRGRVVVFSDFL